MELSAITKTVVNVLTVVVTAGPWVLDALHVFPGGTAAATIVSSVLGVAGVILHYLAPNQTVHPAKAERQSVRLKKTTRRPRKVAA
jgi:hypothetical protein